VIKENRGCTDIFFLIVYILFWGLMIYVGIVGFINGDPNRLISGYDFNGNICGQGNKSDSPYLCGHNFVESDSLRTHFPE
jgi:hypothetical protein